MKYLLSLIALFYWMNVGYSQSAGGRVGGRTAPALPPKPFQPEQFEASFQRATFTHPVSGKTLDYRILYPLHYKENLRYPLVVFLHGSGERGHDNSLQLKHGAEYFLLDSVRQQYKAIVVFPQCPSDDTWVNISNYKENADYSNAPTIAMENVMGLVDSLKSLPIIDTTKIVGVGFSMGAFGIMELAYRLPDVFKRLMPIAGGHDPQAAKLLSKSAIWAFHGNRDEAVPVQLSINMAQSIGARIGSDFTLTQYPTKGHEIVPDVFKEKQIWMWMFNKYPKKR